MSRLAALALLAPSALAQIPCLELLPAPQAAPDESLRAAEWFDAGGGVELYVGGFFKNFGSASVEFVGRWDGSALQPLGSGVDGTLAGSFVIGESVLALQVWNDGTRDLLVVGGVFQTAGGVDSPHVAAWDGQQWSALGAGLPDLVTDFAVTESSGVTQLHALWTNTTSGLSAPLRTTVSRYSPQQQAWVPQFVFESASARMGVWDDGQLQRPVLYGIAPDGTEGVWAVDTAGATLLGGGGLDGQFFDFETADFGAGPRLMVGGANLTVAGQGGPAAALMFDGTQWSAVPGVEAFPSLTGWIGIQAWERLPGAGGDRLLALGAGLQLPDGGPLASSLTFDGVAWTREAEALLFANDQRSYYDAALADAPDGEWGRIALAGSSSTTHALDGSVSGLAFYGSSPPGGGSIYGDGCPTTAGAVPELALAGCAAAGSTLELELTGLPPSATAVLGYAAQPAALPLGQGCTLLLDPFTLRLIPAAGGAAWQLSVPSSFLVERVYLQGFGIEVFPSLGVLSASAGLEVPFAIGLGTGL